MPRLPLVTAAGGLALDPEERVLFIFKDGRWDLPKGLVERGRNPEDTALAETAEETGLPLSSLSVVEPLIPTHHISKFGGRRSLKRVDWFLLRCSAPAAPLHPQVEEGIERCQWIDRRELATPLANCPSRIDYVLRFWKKYRKALRRETRG